MDSFKLTNGSYDIQEAHIMHAIRTIRGMRMMSSVPLLFFPENAPGNIGEQVLQLLVRNDVRNYFITRESAAKANVSREGGRVGITPTATLKNDMTARFMRLVRDRGLFFSELFVAGPGEEDTANRVAHLTATPQMREKVCRQAASWELVTKATQSGRVSTYWSGKLAGNDDLMVSLLYAVHFALEFMTSNRSDMASYRRRINSRRLLVPA